MNIKRWKSEKVLVWIVVLCDGVFVRHVDCDTDWSAMIETAQ
jgi:hypothetical protein